MDVLVHRPVALVIVDALQQIFADHKQADKVIESVFKQNRKLGSRDRRQIAETVYDLVRWWRKYLWLSRIEWPSEDTSPNLRPEQYWTVLLAYAIIHKIKIQGADNVRIREGLERQPRSIQQSFPNWFDEWCSKETAAWEEYSKLLNHPAPVFLRANTLKIRPRELLDRLASRNTPAQLVGDDAIVLLERANLFVSDEFKQGLFEIQDIHSQMIAPFLQVEPGQRVVDACAGAGGKALHLAALMKNKGKIIAMDVSTRKLEELRKRSSRDGCQVIETKLIESTKTIKRLDQSADRVLLDVPCSGTGVLRRNPDAKWRLSADRIQALHMLQSEILENYARMVKPNGLLVYSTCSIAQSENQGQVEAFLKRSTAFRLEKELILSPTPDGGDGFYAARIRRLS